MRALISVADKRGIVSLAQSLVDLGYAIISTGGTAATLRAAGVAVEDVATVTGAAEMLDGRVKTLHPAIHGAILARRDDPAHMAQLAAQHITPIDLVVCNLYDFAATVADATIEPAAAVEQIDIGGVALLRASAKNFEFVTVLANIADYDSVVAALRGGEMTLARRRDLAARAFAHTAAYDSLIAMYLLSSSSSNNSTAGDSLPGGSAPGIDVLFPDDLTLPLHRISLPRYGENPHQQAAFYHWRAPGRDDRATIVDAEVLHGKELGFNNLMDLDAALNIVREQASPAVAIVKHAGPCGVATDPDLESAFRRALAGDPVSAFGGVIGLNRPVDLATATAIRETHFDAIIAPDYAPEALALLEKRRNLILVATHRPIAPDAVSNPFFRLDVRRVSGGLLVQTPDAIPLAEVERTLRVVTERAPGATELQDLLFAWSVVKFVKSNAIVLASARATVGLCGGQPNRVDAVRIAAMRAGDRAAGSVLASDAYFPFADNIDEAAKAGVAAIIQPGGSIRDEEVIAAANAHGMAMVFSGYRAFRH